eukprot:scaffold273202_cov20-Prasinocladus_malaysianus.AAC.1
MHTETSTRSRYGRWQIDLCRRLATTVLILLRLLIRVLMRDTLAEPYPPISGGGHDLPYLDTSNRTRT